VAFEKRMVAAVADPGVLDVSEQWVAHLPQQLLDLLDAGQKEAFNAAMATAQANADDEQFFPGQPQQLYDLLTGEKAIIGFAQNEGANFHCQPTGRQLTHTQMLDFLADHLPVSGLC
jgi:hypothetical protein